MTRQYKLEVERPSANPVLYIHEDDTLEIMDADSGSNFVYLLRKLEIFKEVVHWMRDFGVTNIECKWVGDE